MARIVKKISDPYSIIATNAAPTCFTVGEASTTNAEVVINGNLTVIGVHSTIESTNTVIYDNIITLNAETAPTATPTLNAGIEVDRGNQPTVTLQWSESVHRWQITNNGSLFEDIMTKVVDDPAPQLGGNLNVNGWTITSTANNIILAPAANTQINSALQLQELNAPITAAIPGFGLLAAGVPGGGQTGLYVTNSAVSNFELVTKKKAIIYALIF